jgi:hypothetical protein
MSLATQVVLLVTGIRFADRRDDLAGIARVRWEGNHAEPEECSVSDLIGWMIRRRGRAYVRRPDGSRGPLLEVVQEPERRYLRSGPGDDGRDFLLALPRI